VSLQLFLVAHLSFRAVSRALAVLSTSLGIAKAPCPQTVINWVIRLSIARIRTCVEPGVLPMSDTRFSAGSIWLLDTSIGLGDGQILAILALPLHHYLVSTCAPTLAQVSCLAVCVAPSWTGERIANVLREVIAVTGCPAAYLKDGGTDLAKAIRLLAETGLGSPCIDDISHVSANLLKHEYQDHPMFSTFLSACGTASKALKQTVLACLAPPKVSAKVRFMNLHRLVRWAHHLLKHSPPGRAPRDSALATLRAALGKMPACKSFIQRFLRDAQALLTCQQIVKDTGLTLESYQTCHTVLDKLPSRSPIRPGFIAWADQQLEVAQALGLEQVGLPVTSDTIESLFGRAKQHGTGEVKDANRIALRLPALSGELTREDVREVLTISVSDQHEVVGVLPSLTKQRRDILPHPGYLEDLCRPKDTPYLALLPGTKNWAKNTITQRLSASYNKSHGPPTPSINAPGLLLEFTEETGR